MQTHGWSTFYLWRCVIRSARIPLFMVVQVLYAVGIVELELESTSALVLLLFIIPLAFTLSGFLMWILYSLNGRLRPLSAHRNY